MESVMVIFGKYKICWREKYEQSTEVDFLYRLGEEDIDEGEVTYSGKRLGQGNRHSGGIQISGPADDGDRFVGWWWNEEKNQLSFKDGSTVYSIAGDNFTLFPPGRLVAATAAGACFYIFHNRWQSTFKRATRSIQVGRRCRESHVLPLSWSCLS